MSKSALEAELALQIRALELPEPIREYVVPGIPRFRYDFAWKNCKLLIEVNGGTYVKSGHTTHKGIDRDYRKNRWAQQLGWRCFSYTGEDVKNGTAIDEIRKALEAE